MTACYRRIVAIGRCLLEVRNRCASERPDCHEERNGDDHRCERDECNDDFDATIAGQYRLMSSAELMSNTPTELPTATAPTNARYTRGISSRLPAK